jgi:uncharacterized protein YbaP (TraB family)
MVMVAPIKAISRLSMRLAAVQVRFTSWESCIQGKPKDFGDSYGVSYDVIKDRDAMSVAATFQTIAAEKAGLSYTYGEDSYWTYRANQIKKEIVEVEGLAYETEVSNRLNSQSADEIIRTITPDINEAVKIQLDGYNTVKIGNDQVLSDQANEQQKSATSLPAIYWLERNNLMIDKVDAYLKTGEVYFVAVGAGHVVGNNGIITVLKQKGYSIRRI